MLFFEKTSKTKKNLLFGAIARKKKRVAFGKSIIKMIYAFLYGRGTMMCRALFIYYMYRAYLGSTDRTYHVDFRLG